MSETEQRSAGRTIARNTFFGVGAQLTLRVASFIFNVLVIRTLGGEAFGQYSIVLAWAGLFSVLGDFGVAQYLSREIARDRNKANELFWDTVLIRIALAASASVVTTGGAIMAGYSTPIVIAIAIYTGSYFFQSVLQPLVSILIGNERIDITSAYWALWQIMIMVLSGLFLFLGFDFTWLVIAQIIVLPVVIGLHLRAMKQANLMPPPFRVNRSVWWMIFRASIPFAVTQLSLSFAFRVDTVVLSANVSDGAVGWYNAAYNLTLTLLTIAQSFNNAILPTLAREHATDPDSVRPWYYTSVKAMMFLGLPIAVGGMLTAGQIVGILYQPAMAPAAIALAILVWDIPVVTYHSFCGNMATSIKREGGAARIYGTLGVVNLLLNLILVPRFGIIGAAFATVLTDLAGAAQFYFLFRHAFGPGLHFDKLARIGVSAAAMGVLIYLMGGVHLFIIAPVAAVVYLALIWVSGAFTPEERARLTGFITRRLRPRAAAS